MVLKIYRLLGIVWLATVTSSKSTNSNNGGGGSSGGGGGIMSGGGGGNSGFLHMFAAQQNPPDPCYEEIPIGLVSNQGNQGSVGPVGVSAVALATSVSSSGTVLRSRRCVPDFVNAAFGKEVTATSTCGNPPSRHCYATTDDKGDLTRLCSLCDSSNARRRHPSTYLTDLHNVNNMTCWQSEPLIPPPAAAAAAASSPGGSSSASVGQHQPSASSASSAVTENNVTLTLSLGKKYELTYISLQFCGRKPDSLAIYKSMDFGKTWQAFQYYSSQCRKLYGRPNRAIITKSNEQEALCTDAHSLLDPLSGSRIAFSTMEGRPSAFDFENSPVLQDWVTATDVRVVFHRFHPYHGDDSSQRSSGGSSGGAAESSNDSNAAASTATATAVSVRDYSFYAAADFAVGGRCKCNGHASRCVQGRDGLLGCDCRHNTAGRDCEKCKPFHFDRPWGRATAKDANECKACNCNLHARRCRFNMELFKLSGRISGGVCLKCRHNTAGRYCHYCKEGYYRDPAKPITHRKACKECECHPVGASGRTCNQTTGQCPCKDGVTGITCNRCAKGYQQSRSPIAPCIRIPKSSVNPAPSSVEPTNSNTEGCGPCPADNRRLNLKKYCKRDYALLATITARETAGEWVKFTMNVQTIFKKTRDNRVRRGLTYFWVRMSDLACKCPKIKINKSYLILGGSEDSKYGRPGIELNTRSIVIEWKAEWISRMRRFERRASRKCK
ncbi:netrin-3-like isoform X1 [Daphnia pulex]|uniref:netrin-3-like isoform X1 n=1 Tax=Daphnia pulex TaxID=6669 RepID=UPI001EDD9BA6|nr:netrin-3-like isoform X1 [Daphnia pulex]